MLKSIVKKEDIIYLVKKQFPQGKFSFFSDEGATFKFSLVVNKERLYCSIIIPYSVLTYQQNKIEVDEWVDYIVDKKTSFQGAFTTF